MPLIAWAAVASFVQGLGKNKGQGQMSDAEKRKLEEMQRQLDQQRINQMRPKTPFR
jgi:hypothetical protein